MSREQLEETTRILGFVGAAISLISASISIFLSTQDTRN